MHLGSGKVCQFLKGTPEGARCSVVNGFIKLIEDADIRLCMGRHHEACLYYAYSLRALAFAAQDGPASRVPVGETISAGGSDEKQ